jgi:peroxiredoxin
MVLEMESRLKEARGLDKVLAVVPSLSAWGCAQVVRALQANPHNVNIEIVAAKSED